MDDRYIVTFGADMSKLLKALKDVETDLDGVSKGAQRTAKDFDAAFAPIGKAFDSMVGGLLKGTETWQKAATQAIRSILTTELESDAKLLARKLATSAGIRAADTTTARTSMLTWLLAEQQKTAATTTGTTARSNAEATQSSGFLGRLAQMLAQWLNLEGAKTTATVTANTDRTASDAAAVVAALAPLKVYGLGAIMAEAGIAAAAAFADMASLGPAGLAAAPGVAAATLGQVMAYTSFLSAEGGAWDLPSDTMLMAHARESVLPAHVAGPMRDFFSAGGNGTGSAAPDIHMHVHAMDARSVRQLLVDNHAAVGEALHRAWRNGNPRTR